MTSGVYPRNPDMNLGRKPALSVEQVASVRRERAAGKKTKFLAAKWRVCEKTIRYALAGRGGYKDTK